MMLDTCSYEIADSLRMRCSRALRMVPERVRFTSAIYPHHWLSHGTPSPSPSIFVFGQLRMKNVASSHERICEQCCRPSQLKRWAGVRITGAGSALAGAAAAVGVASGTGAWKWR